MRGIVVLVTGAFIGIQRCGLVTERYGYRCEGLAVVYFESLPGLRRGGPWVEHDIAKPRYAKRSALWSRYGQLSELRWQRYSPLPYSDDLAELVEEMQRDPTSIFFG